MTSTKPPVTIYGQEVSSFGADTFGIRVRAQDGKATPKHIRDAYFMSSGKRRNIGTGDVLLVESGSELMIDVGYKAIYTTNLGFGVKVETPRVRVLVDALYFPVRPGEDLKNWVYGVVDRDDEGTRILVKPGRELKPNQDPSLYWKLRFWVWPIQKWEVSGEVFGEPTQPISMTRSSGNLGAAVRGDDVGRTVNLRHARILAADESEAIDYTLHLFSAPAMFVKAPVAAGPVSSNLNEGAS